MHHSGVVCSTLCGAYSTKTYLVLWALATNTTSTSTTPVHCSALCSVWEDLSLSFSCLEERLELLHLSVCHSLLFTLFTLFTSFSSVTTNTSKCWPSTAKWFPCYIISFKSPFFIFPACHSIVSPWISIRWVSKSNPLKPNLAGVESRLPNTLMNQLI